MTDDTKRLEWVMKHSATVVPGNRMKTRRGGITKDNLERVWQLEWKAPNGDLIMQTPDTGYKTFRDAIDAAMGEVITPDKTAI